MHVFDNIQNNIRLKFWETIRMFENIYELIISY